MKKARPVIGIVLIIAAIGTMYYWETSGRKAWTMDTVAVAAAHIDKGTVITPELFTQQPVPDENLMEGALTWSGLAAYGGWTAERDIEANSQVSASFFREDSVTVPEGRSIFAIRPYWIDTFSSSLRQGDRVSIYTYDGARSLGSYVVAFVKDSSMQEIITQDKVTEPEDALDRKLTGRVTSYIEIICTLDEYLAIRAAAEEEGQTLIIVQEGSAA